jgi:hypothetical protein
MIMAGGATALHMGAPALAGMVALRGVAASPGMRASAVVALVVMVAAATGAEWRSVEAYPARLELGGSLGGK